jgi:DNA-binding NarL/FixJ family response regulator
MIDMTTPLRVYIVEDSEVIQELLASALAARGAEVTGCSGDPQEAIADVFELQPDLIVIDIGLTTGSGFDVLRTLKERNLVPHATKVVLTNHANSEYAALSARLGADGFYDKTWEMPEALAFIAAEAAAPGARRTGILGANAAS